MLLYSNGSILIVYAEPRRDSPFEKGGGGGPKATLGLLGVDRGR